MVLDPIPQFLPVHFFGSRTQPPTSLRGAVDLWIMYIYIHCARVCVCVLTCTYGFPRNHTTNPQQRATHPHHTSTPPHCARVRTHTHEEAVCSISNPQQRASARTHIHTYTQQRAIEKRTGFVGRYTLHTTTVKRTGCVGKREQGL